MERLIQQYQCSQEMDNSKVEIVRNLELENPMIFDELQNKKKQTYVEKNT